MAVALHPRKGLGHSSQIFVESMDVRLEGKIKGHRGLNPRLWNGQMLFSHGLT